jgi:hypothetical protein
MRPYILRRMVGMAALIAAFAGCSDDLGRRGSTDQGVKAAASRATTTPSAYTPEPDQPRPTTTNPTTRAAAPPIYTPEPDEPRHTPR